ncbi:MAG TPA: TetR/AcrR family transcriptional regulator [Candidatus Eisenbacteria bacterium]|jgi:AcrR family transcriptional regulator
MDGPRAERIRIAAMEALYDKGYHGTSLRDIARGVGIQAPSLYNYFPSKQELLYHLMRSVMEDLIRQVRTAVARAGPDPVDGLRAAVRAFVLFNVRRPHEAAVSDAGFKALTSENRERVVRLRDTFESIFTGLLEAGAASGRLRVPDVGIIRNTLLSACARVYFWYRADGRRSPDELGDLVSDYLVAGLRAPAGDRGAAP